MSGKGGGVINGVGKGISGIPAGSKKMVQSLKEVVKNHSEQDIYATLKDCNMDPNEAVSRLLSQDPFHEVKSKKEKKKDNKDTGDFRSHGANNNSYTTNRGSRGGAERYAGRGGSTQYSANESGTSHGKTTYKRENGVHAPAVTSSAASGDRQPVSYSDSVVPENKTPTVGFGDGIPSSSQPSSGYSSEYQSSWLVAPGQRSMADIVKMGRPQNKVSTMSNPPRQSVNSRHSGAPPPAVLHHQLHSLEDHATKGSETNHEPGAVTNRGITSNDDWTLIENPSAASVSSILKSPADLEVYPLDETKQQTNSHIEEAEALEDGSDETYDGNDVGHPDLGRNIQEDNSGGSSLFDRNLYNDAGTYLPRKHEAEDGITSVASNLEQLNLKNEDRGATPEEDNPAVIIPNHLQVHAPTCSHLSFGSFGSGIGLSFSGPFASMSSKTELDESTEAADGSSMGHSDNRNSEYYGDEHLRNTEEGNIADMSAGNRNAEYYGDDEHLRNTTEENIVDINNASAGNYEASSDSRSEILKQDSPQAGQGDQYAFPSSGSVYGYENAQQLNPQLVHSQNPQIQNLAQFSNVMQAYNNSLPSALLASTVQSAREQDLPYSPFPMAQSVAKFSNPASTIGGPTSSMPEALRAGTISAPQQTQQTLPGDNVATGPAAPQHLAMHPYSQPTLPLGHYANMIGYPFLPQSYTYMPSAFQQAFAGNNSYPQSLAAMLPQYKNSVSVSSLPQSAAVASGYGFGSSTNIPGGNFPLNQPTALAGTTVGYNDILSSQYKDNSHLMSLQQAQNENSAMWVHGPGSRTMSAVPGNNYYSFQGQNQQQQPSGFRQGQQPSQHFGGLGYPNFYHSQMGMSMEHQQQNPREGSLSGSQVQPSKQTQQLWQNGY